MAVLLEAYEGISEVDAVEMTVVDLRWQMAVDRLGSKEPAFGQGTLVAFRERVIRSEMDRRLLERTIEFVRRTRVLELNKLPKTVRVSIDSTPLEDTISRSGYAAREVAQCAADLLGWSLEHVAEEALLEPNEGKAPDVKWSNPDAINILIRRIDALDAWVRYNPRVRERVVVEYGLAHLARRQGRRARYRGVRKNLFDLRRTAAAQNLETVHGVTDLGLRSTA